MPRMRAELPLQFKQQYFRRPLLPATKQRRVKSSQMRRPWWLRLSPREPGVPNGLSPCGTYLDYIWCRHGS